eukprot:Anaeramoba_ignava/a2962_389.p1 GENE.a2962_389~~a2962_389.p1  ORF type:complete len:681 (-),score=104.28 a2962_389:142-2184(-)
MKLHFQICRDFFFHFVIIITILINVFAPVTYKQTKKIDDFDLGYQVKKEATFGNGTDRLFYFMQVSDTHISKYVSTREKHFSTFCNDFARAFDPSFVIHSGDITDDKANKRGIFMNHPNEEEWETYANTLKQSGFYHQSNWMDIRGNHDASAIIGKYSDNNYYYTYSPWGQYLNSIGRPQVYNSMRHMIFGTYNFIAIDFTTYPQVSAPLGFFGFITKDILDDLEAILVDAEQNHQVNQTILIHHFPFSLLSSQAAKSSKGNSIKDLISKYRIIALLDGHLHSTKAEARILDGKVLDLSLGDMKKHKSFRICAFDEDIFSFIDTDIDHTDPIILITNPKDCRYLSPREPLEKIKYSQNIRALVFSPIGFDSTTIAKATCQIDGNTVSSNMTKISDVPLMYTAPWDPNRYAGETHDIAIHLMDKNGNIITSQSQSFSTTYHPKKIGKGIFEIIQHQNVSTSIIAWMTILYLFYGFGFVILPKILRLVLLKTKSYEKFDHKMNNFCERKAQWWKFPYHQFLSMIWKFGKIPNSIWFIFLWAVLSPLFIPFVLGPMIVHTWGAGFIWGVAIHHSVTFYPMIGFYFILYFLGMIFPALTVVSLPFVDRDLRNFSDFLRNPTAILSACGILAIDGWFIYLLVLGYGAAGLLLSVVFMWNSGILVFLIIYIIKSHSKKKVYEKLVN